MADVPCDPDPAPNTVGGGEGGGNPDDPDDPDDHDPAVLIKKPGGKKSDSRRGLVAK